MLTLFFVQTLPATLRKKRAVDPVHDFAYARLMVALAAAAFIAAPYPYMPSPMDRYLLPALAPGLILAAGPLRDRRSRIFAAVVCAVYFAFSVAAQQDYLSWNRARWAAIHRLIDERGVNPLEIDGGFEYNGLYTSEAFTKRYHPKTFWDGLGYQWLLSDRYALSFNPRDECVTLERAPYFSYLGMTTRALYVLERPNAPRVPAQKP